MTVCQIFPHYAPVLAGAAERFRRYAPGLLERGVQTEVITSRSDPSLLEHEVIDGLIPVSRMEVGNVAKDRDLHLFQAAEAHLHQQGRAGAPVVQTIKMDRRLLRSAWKIRRQGRSLVYVSTMVEPETWGRTVFHRWANLQLQKLFAQIFDAVVVGSPVMAQAQRRVGVRHSRLHTISHGVDVKRFRPAKNDRPELLAHLLPPDAKVCLYVGHLIPRKGIAALLKAWPAVAEKHAEAWLVLVGAIHRPTISSEQERGEIEAYQSALFRDLQALPRVLHIPPQPDIERWYQLADVFAFPSTQEGFPNALLEAMSSGLPCLTRRFMGFPTGQLGEQHGVIEVVPEAEGAWSAALCGLLQNAERRASMAAAARDLIVREHALENTLDAYAALYQQLAAKHRPAA